MDRFRTLGHSDIKVTAIGYGCMGQTHSYGVVEAEQDMIDLMRYAFEVGYTFFDTAPIYGEENEIYLGKAVAPFRDQAVIATKFGIVNESFFSGDQEALNSSRASLLEQVDASLKRLGTDHIDLYYQHRIDPKTEPEEVAETMAELIQAGKIRAWGVSFAPEEYIRRAHKVCPISAVENMYSFVARKDEATYFPLCEELGISYVSACPLAKGYLTNRYPAGTKYREGDWRADINLFKKEGIDQNRGLMDLILAYAEKKNATPAQIALAWEITKKPYLIPIPGTTKKARVKENFEAVNVELTEQEMNEIETALAQMDIVGMHR
ncbi:MAG: aldo/keto reductase [Solobacterium sp.]|nr:aldo/keto reductase [Solobacterium sp.]